MDYIQERVKSHLKKKRYIHTLGVVEFAEKLAKHYGVCEKKARIASLLHDYCKYYSNEQMLNGLRNANFEIDEVLLNKINLGHGFLAGIIVKNEFNIEDEDIINAVTHHTFGRKGMSKLEKIIYLADSLEMNRTYDGVDDLRKLAFISLERTLLRVCESTLMYELQRGSLIHSNSIELRNELLLCMED